MKPSALVGGLLLIVSAFLQWILGGGSATAFDVPVQALWDIETADGPVKLGFVLVAIGARSGAGSRSGSAPRGSVVCAGASVWRSSSASRSRSTG